MWRRPHSSTLSWSLAKEEEKEEPDFPLGAEAGSSDGGGDSGAGSGSGMQSDAASTTSSGVTCIFGDMRLNYANTWGAGAGGFGSGHHQLGGGGPQPRLLK